MDTMAIGNGTNDLLISRAGATLNLQTGGVLLSYGNATFSAGSTLNISGGTLSALGTAEFDIRRLDHSQQRRIEPQ